MIAMVTYNVCVNSIDVTNCLDIILLHYYVIILYYDVICNAVYLRESSITQSIIYLYLILADIEN